MNTPLLAGEAVVKHGMANMQRNIEAVGGNLYLTNMRLIFEAHALNVQTGNTVIPLARIDNVRTRWTKFLGLLPLFPNSIGVTTRDGQDCRFVVFGKGEWMAAIDEQRAMAGDRELPKEMQGPAAPQHTAQPAGSPYAAAPPSAPGYHGGQPPQSYGQPQQGYGPPRPTGKDVSVLGVLSLVLGIFGFPLALVPCVNILAIPIVGLGLLLGGIGWIMARSNRRTGTGLPTAGIVANLLGVGVTAAWFAFIAWSVQAEQARQEEMKKQVSAGPWIALTAEELHSAYDANKTAADNKYKNKVLELSGEIAGITISPGGSDIDVKLYTTEDFDKVICEFESEQRGAVEELELGQQVTIRGACRGEFIGDVTLRFCIIAPADPAEAERQAAIQEQIRSGPAIALTAQELQDAYKADAAEADRMYKNQVLEITGELDEFHYPRDDGVDLELTTTDEFDSLYCEFEEEHRDAVEMLEYGQQVIVRGLCRGVTNGDVRLRLCILKAETPPEE